MSGVSEKIQNPWPITSRIQASASTIKAIQVRVRIWGNLLCNELYKTITHNLPVAEYQIGSLCRLVKTQLLLAFV